MRQGREELMNDTDKKQRDLDEKMTTLQEILMSNSDKIQHCIKKKGT